MTLKVFIRWGGSLAWVAVFLVLCGTKDPGQNPLVIVSSDTLTAADLDQQLAAMLGDSAAIVSLSDSAKDSVKKQLMQNWIDRKLVLRQARAEEFVFDSASVAAFRAGMLARNRAAPLDDEGLKVLLYLQTIAEKQPVRKWDIRHYIKQEKQKTGKAIQYETARRIMQEQKLLEWVENLRTRGGFRFLDVALRSQPVSAQFVGCCISRALGEVATDSILTQAIEQLKSVQVDRKLKSKEDMDSTTLAAMDIIFNKDKVEATRLEKKKESKAHLFRSAESIQKTITRYLPQLQRGFKRELRRNPSLDGRVVVRIVIAEKGDVTGAQVTETEIGDQVYLEKLVQTIKTWEFKGIPRDAGEMVVSYPFEFTAKE